MNRILNRELLPTSGIRAGLSAITPAAFLPISGILLAIPLPDCSISLPVESHAMYVLLHLPEFILCVHAIPNPNPDAFYIFLHSLKIAETVHLSDSVFFVILSFFLKATCVETAALLEGCDLWLFWNFLHWFSPVCVVLEFETALKTDNVCLQMYLCNIESRGLQKWATSLCCTGNPNFFCIDTSELMYLGVKTNMESCNILALEPA